MSELPVAEFLQGLREAHETYKHLVEGIPASLYVDAVDDLSTNLYTSPQIQTLLGFTVQEWTEDPNLWIARMHEDDRERVVRAHQESNRTGGPFNTEYRVYARDGSVVWVHDEAVLVRDENGEPMYWRGIMSDLSKQKQAEEKLRKSLDVLRRTMEDRRQLLLRLEDAQEEERRRIAADIHDDSIQVMSAADIRAQSLARQITDPELRAEADELRETIRVAVDRLRHLLFELRPPALDREGLVSALRAYSSDMKPVPEIVDELGSEPPSDIRVILFRIAQEAIANARKHAEAGAITVSLATEDGGVHVVITDDGRGFDTVALDSPQPGHIGLPTMVERAELAGGRCRIQSRPGEGTTVDAWVPFGMAVPANAGA
ncbi:MAG TPA: PAS domain-containing protein [Actinomycetota bacterium]|nr:PAS domain-containing protein [Actinomycetota bacterium]